MTQQVAHPFQEIPYADLTHAIEDFKALDNELEERQNKRIYWTSNEENKNIAEWKQRLNGGQ